MYQMKYVVVHFAQNWLDKPYTVRIYGRPTVRIFILSKREREKKGKNYSATSTGFVSFGYSILFKSTQSGACRNAVRRCSFGTPNYRREILHLCENSMFADPVTSECGSVIGSRAADP